jgi:hypothetical protein
MENHMNTINCLLLWLVIVPKGEIVSLFIVYLTTLYLAETAQRRENYKLLPIISVN